MDKRGIKNYLHSKHKKMFNIIPLTILDVVVILDNENDPQNFTPSVLSDRTPFATSENEEGDLEII